MRGSVTRLTPKSWRLRWDVGTDETGRRRQASKTVRGTRREADAELRRMLGAPTPNHPHTCAELFDAWIDHTEHRLAARTVDDRRRTWRLHLAPTLARHNTADIGPAQLDAIYTDMRRAGYTPATVLAAHATARGMFAQAVKWGWVDANPATRATPPRQKATNPAVPDLDNLRRVLDHLDATHPTSGAMYRLAALTGMRRGELCALRWGDIDPDAATITVRRSLVTVGGRIIEKATKTGRERRIAVGAHTLALLRGHRARIAEARIACGVGHDDTGYVFPSTLDMVRPTWPSTVTARWRAACQACGVTATRLHDLRHHSASQLVAAGVDLRTVLERHGWTNLATAQRYVHAVEEKDRAAADVLERVLG